MMNVSVPFLEFAFEVPHFLIPNHAEVCIGTCKRDEIADVSFLHLALEAALPDIPESSVLSDTMNEDAGVTLTLQTGFPFFLSPLELHGEVVIFKLFIRGEPAVDLACDFKNRLAVFFNHGEDFE